MKKAKPSRLNGMPMMPPANSMKRGHSNPSSNESIVPDTAPIPNVTANAFDHVRANWR